MDSLFHPPAAPSSGQLRIWDGFGAGWSLHSAGAGCGWCRAQSRGARARLEQPPRVKGSWESLPMHPLWCRARSWRILTLGMQIQGWCGELQITRQEFTGGLTLCRQGWRMINALEFVSLVTPGIANNCLVYSGAWALISDSSASHFYMWHCWEMNLYIKSFLSGIIYTWCAEKWNIFNYIVQKSWATLERKWAVLCWDRVWMLCSK